MKSRITVERGSISYYSDNTSNYPYMDVPIKFALIPLFLEKFKEKIEKIKEKDEFCSGMFFEICWDVFYNPVTQCNLYWSIRKKTAKDLEENGFHKISDDTINQANTIKIPEVSLMIVFDDPACEAFSDLDEHKKFLDKILPIQKIVEEIINEISRD